MAPPFPPVIIRGTCWDRSNHCTACSETQPSKVRGRLLAFASISPSLASRAVREVVCASRGAGGCFSRNQAKPSRSRAGLASQISCSVQISIVQNKVREGEAGGEMERLFRPVPCGVRAPAPGRGHERPWGGPGLEPTARTLLRGVQAGCLHSQRLTFSSLRQPESGSRHL